MNLNEIHFHDSILLRVIEETESDQLCLEVDYPTDWENNIYQRRTILFTDVLNYQVYEGAFHGSPTILGVSEISEENNRKLIQIDTNAGYRLLAFKHVELKQRKT